jgi:Tfp pilus assembly protein PilO
MNKLTKEKRNHLILIFLGTAGVVVGLWMGLISLQKRKISDINTRIESTEQQISKVEQVAREASQVQVQLKQVSERLQEIESAMPAGDAYAWINSTLRGFNRPGYRVEMPSIGPPMPGEMTMLPSFPYRQITVSVSGTAFFSDFGQFLQDFENRFPYMRVQSFTLVPGASPIPEEREKLNFNVEIVALTRIGLP